MRLPRNELLSRLTDGVAPRVIVFEAPHGYGKSWLLHRLRSQHDLRYRGSLKGATTEAIQGAPVVLVDDAHLLTTAEIDQLVACIEDQDPTTRFVIAGRLLDDRIHTAARLVDGVIFDADRLAVVAEELTSHARHLPSCDARRIVEVARGQVHTISTAISVLERRPRATPASVVTRLVRDSATATVTSLSSTDRSIVGILARMHDIPATVLARLTDRDAIGRLVAAGVPLIRQGVDRISVLNRFAFSQLSIDSRIAVQAADELIQDHPIEVIQMLIDAGQDEKVTEIILELPHSTWVSLDPRATTGALQRLGDAVDENADLLIARATANHVAGRRGEVRGDIDRALSLSHTLPAAHRQRILAQAARLLVSLPTVDRSPSGREENLPNVRAEEILQARAIAQQVLRDAGAGDDYTMAMAHFVTARCAAESQRVEELHQAADSYRRAIESWTRIGEKGFVALARTDLAVGILQDLGRFDEALTTMRDIQDDPDISEIERNRAFLFEGFILVNAGRTADAQSRFRLVLDYARATNDDRLIRGSTWGLAVVAHRRGQQDEAIQWLTQAELAGPMDTDAEWDPLFYCDAVEILGSAAEFEAAQRYLERAKRHTARALDHVDVCEFVLRARQGDLGDLDVMLTRTAPLNRWRVLLTAAYAAALNGDDEQARGLWTESDRERNALRLPSPDSLGERLLVERLRDLLAKETPTSVGGRATATTWFGVLGPLVVRDGDTDIDVGPRQRRTVLAVLVSSANHAVPPERLIDAVWNGTSKPSSAGSLHSHISRLRAALGPDRIVRRHDGYVLDVAPDELDVAAFERTAADGRASIGAGDVPTGREQLAEALDLWRGDAFQDFMYEDWARAEAIRLDEERLMTLEVRIEADLALGRQRDLIGELEAIVHAHPTRERFCAQLMTALHLSGRQRDALATYRAYREQLVDDTGLEPSPGLQHLYDGIVRDDIAGSGGARAT